MAIIAKRNEMPSQDPQVRAHNFGEVALGYDVHLAEAEAQRCLNCKNRPCVEACPVHVEIPDFISLCKEGKWEEAYQVIAAPSSLPAICGRVCPQETQCESKCTLGVKFEPVAIGRLERFVSDRHNELGTKPLKPTSNGHRVAVVGSGPSGLTCAGDLAKKGYQVTVFEALHKVGGVLAYGIPEFRLPKSVLKREVDALVSLGVELATNVVIGKTLT
ncbi:MAG: NAD(P)-binding protein, partial [Clostridia bacterium]|nr:NAD(P)-binding protein [Clostridia bacterium]